jgi:hypothetical protein
VRENFLSPQPEGSSYPTSNLLDTWLIPSCLNIGIIACATKPLLSEFIKTFKLHALS